MIKCKVFSIFHLLIICIVLSNCNLRSFSTPAAWIVTNAKSKVVFLGSIHSGTFDMYPLHPKLERYFKNSDYLFVENINNISQNELIELNEFYIKCGKYKNLNTLYDNIPIDLYLDIRNQLSGTALKKVFNYYKPWYLLNEIDKSDARNDGSYIKYGVESYLIQEAKIQNKKISGLESYNSYYKYFVLADKLNNLAVWQLQNIVDKKKQTEMVEIINGWKIGDLKPLYESYNVVNQEQMVIDEMSIYLNSIVTERNLNWLPTIVNILESKGSYLIVAGGMHFNGNGGLLELVKSKGYKIEPFSY